MAGSGRKARIAVAGLGRIGRVHATNLAGRCPSTDLVAVFDPLHDIAQSVGGQLGARTVPTYDDLIGDGSVDGVVIATPTGVHAELAIAAARGGKHVFCEKPLSLERPVTVRVVQEAAEAGVKLQVGFHRRFDPATAAAAERVLDGELGDVHLLRTSQRDMAPPPQDFLAASGGIFLDMGIHDFDLARWLVGEVASVSAHVPVDPGPGEGTAATGDFHTAAVVLCFVTGALGVMDISRVAGYGYESSVELMGSMATVRVDDPFAYGYEWRTSGTAARPLVPSFDRRFSDAFSAELEQFARCILDDSPPLASGLDALAAFDLARAAEESCRTGRPVAVGPPTGPTRIGPDSAGQESTRRFVR